MSLLSYHEYEKKVYDWLIEKNKREPEFRFGLRRKASKGSERDYFIGTERSGYFATTFWTVHVSFPGSSGELISLVFRFSNENYNFEFSQTRNPPDRQNEFALRLIRNIKPKIKKAFELSYESPEGNKMENFQTPFKTFSDLSLMFKNIELELKLLLSIVNAEILNLKKEFSSFVARPINEKDFDAYKSKLDRRLKKYLKWKVFKNTSIKSVRFHSNRFMRWQSFLDQLN